MICPICKTDLVEKASGKFECDNNEGCGMYWVELADHEWQAIAQALAAARADGLEEAALYLDKEAAAMYMIDAIRAMK